MLVTVEAKLSDAQGDIASRYTYFQVTKRQQDHFNFLMWDLPRGALATYAEEALAHTGVSAQLTNGNPPPWVAANEISWVPYATRILAKSDKNYPRWFDRQAFKSYNIEVEVTPNSPSFLLLTKRPMPEFAVRLAAKAAHRGDVVHGRISVDKPDGVYAFRLRVSAGGRTIERLTRNILVGKDPEEFDVPIAYNDPDADYEVSATELFTGRVANVVLDVRGAP